MTSSTGGSLIYKSSISYLFSMVFKELVIDVFSILKVISFLNFCFTVNPEFLNAFASFSERQVIRTSFTGDSFFNNLLSFPFVALTLYFGTKNDFYESENYNGDGCAHDVKR